MHRGNCNTSKAHPLLEGDKVAQWSMPHRAGGEAPHEWMQGEGCLPGLEQAETGLAW